MQLLIVQLPAFSCYFIPFLGPNILIRTLFSNTLSLCSSLSVRDQVSRPYKTTGRINIVSQTSRNSLHLSLWCNSLLWLCWRWTASSKAINHTTGYNQYWFSFVLKLAFSISIYYDISITLCVLCFTVYYKCCHVDAVKGFSGLRFT
jgi:hypothetical protein